MKKKLLLPLCCLALFLTLLAGCGPTSDTESSDSSSSGSTAQTTTPQETEATDPEETEATTGSNETTAPDTDTTTKPEETPTTEPTTEPTTGTTTAPSGKGEAIAALAKSLVGTTFEMGATGPDKFDNSGLIYYCMKENGITVPRLTRDMYAAGTAVEKADLQPGDVVFFYVDTEGAVQFAGIYIGDNQMVTSNNPDNPTRIYDMSTPYFSTRYIGARRF